MGTQALTHQMIAREAAAMLVEENTVVSNINTDREEEFGEAVNGYKKGDSVKIKVPPVPVVYDGATFAAGGAAPSLQEGSVTLQLTTQKHVALTFTAKEKKLDLTDFKERYLRPAMNSLGAVVNADLLTQFKNLTPNAIQLTATPRTDWRNACSVLNRFLAPPDQRSAHITSNVNSAMGEQNATLFHDSKEIRGEFNDNAVGRFAGFDFYEQQSNPVHVNGAGAGYVMNGAGVDGASQLAVTTGTGAINKGTIITVANVFAVHPLTGVTNGQLRQFVVTADYAGGAGNIQIYPALNLTTANKVGNINALPANGANVTLLANAAGKATNLGFHRNAYAAAFAPLPVLASCEGYTATVKGVSVRVMTFGDGKSDTESTRVDVLYGYCAPRPDHAVRGIEA